MGRKGDDLENPLDEYRRHLILAEQKAQEDYDKTVLLLSGGALGISFTFVDKIVGDNPIACAPLLYIAWIAWAVSMGCVLSSYFYSVLANRRAIEQVDSNEIRNQPPGGKFSRAIDTLNVTGGVLFVLGVCFMVTFAGKNLGGSRHGESGTRKSCGTEASEKIAGGRIQTTATPTSTSTKAEREVIDAGSHK